MSVIETENNSIENIYEDRMSFENEIDKIIEMQTREESRLPYRERRKFALKQLNKQDIKDYMDFTNNNIILFDVEKIRKEKEDLIEEEIKKRMFERNLNEEMLEDIRLEVLDSLNSSDEYEYEKEEIKENSNILIIESRDPIDIEISKTNPDSTMDTKLEESRISKKSEDNFWAKNNIYDIIESTEIADKIGIKRKVFDDQNYVFINKNDLKTYHFIISQKLFKNKFSTENIENDNFKKEYGLCFCGKDIKEYNKKCRPNEMMCSDCMNENIKIYNLNEINNNALININGRVCIPFKSGGYHCYGTFYCGNKLNYCLCKDFACKACKELNEKKEYYNKN